MKLAITRETIGRTRQQKRQAVLPLIFLLPTISILLLLQVAPALYTLYLSTTRMRRGQLELVGIDNYIRLFQLSSFTDSVISTTAYAGVYVALTVSIGIMLGILLNQPLRFGRIYLVIIFLPWVLSDVVTGTIWRWLFQPDYGIFQEWLFQLSSHSLYTSAFGAMAIVIIASVWQSLAFTTLLTLSALKTIPKEIHESAAIDGANAIQRLSQITFPLISRHILVMVLLISIRAVNSVGLIYSTTGGGPGRSTQTLAVYLLTIAREQGAFGLGAAISVVMLTINLLLTGVYIYLIRKSKLFPPEILNG